MKHLEFSLVRTTRPLPQYGLREGALGTVLEVYDDGAGYDVEFPDADNLSHVVTVQGEQIEPAHMADSKAASTPVR